MVLQREQLKWVEAMPLFGKRIVVTRARSQASELVDRIEELGGEPYEFPVIETIMPEGAEKKAKIAAAFGALESYDWVFFTSPNGVEFFGATWRSWGRTFAGYTARVLQRWDQAQPPRWRSAG